MMRLPTPAARRAKGLPYATKAEFCSHWKIDRSTVWRWEQDPEFMRLIHNDVLGIISIDDAQKIIQTMKVKAFDGNVQAAKFLLEWAGLVGPKASKPLAPDLDAEENAVKGMTDEELRKLIADEDFAEASGVSEEFYDSYDSAD